MSKNRPRTEKDGKTVSLNFTKNKYYCAVSFLKRVFLKKNRIFDSKILKSMILKLNSFYKNNSQKNDFQ